MKSLKRNKMIVRALRGTSGAASKLWSVLSSTRGRHITSLTALISALTFSSIVTGAITASTCDECSESSNDSGDGDVCHEDDCNDCGSGDANQGAQPQGGVGDPEPRPVVWETGEKWESDVDLLVKLKGKDFPLIRKYTSDLQLFEAPYASRARVTTVFGGDIMPGPEVNPILGLGWSIGNLRGVAARSHYACLSVGQCNCTPVLDEHGEPTGETNCDTAYGWVPYEETAVQLVRAGRKPREYQITGPAASTQSTDNSPGNQLVYFKPGASLVHELIGNCGCNSNAALSSGRITGTAVFEEPGKWLQEYKLELGFGFISHDEDVYGNTRDYVDTGTDGVPDIIWLNGTVGGTSAADWTDTDRAEAWVELYWDTTRVGTNQYLLKRAEVYRPTLAAPYYEMTQYVEYHHLVDDATNGLIVEYHDGTSLATSNASPSLDIGSDGDLVQVVTYAETNPDDTVDEWQAQVKQYRYHDPNALYNPPSEDYDIRLDVAGDFHELKMVFNPQQVEFAAQKSSTITTPDDSSVVTLATAFLSLDDSDDVYTGVPMFTTAAKILSYDTTTASGELHPVERQFLLAEGCGCGSSGATTAVMRNYERFDWTKTFGSGPGSIDRDGRTMEISEFEVSDFGVDPSAGSAVAYRSYYYDLLFLGDNGDKPYLWMNATVDGATDDAWVHRKLYDYDLRAVIGKVEPSGHTAYTPADGIDPPSFTSAGTGNGLQTSYTYEASTENENVGTVSMGGIGDTDLVYETQYRTDENYREHLPETYIDYRTATASTDFHKEVTTFEYGFDGATAKIQWRKSTAERELSGENGPDGTGNTVSSWEFYDDQGLTIWQIDEGSSLTRFEYDELTGERTKVVHNANPTNYSSEISTLNALVTSENPFPTAATSDGELVTTYQHDLIGRVTKITEPGDVNRWVVREMVEDADRAGILYFGNTSLPHLVSSVGDKTFDGPAVRSISDAAGDRTRSSAFELSTTASYDPDSGTYSIQSSNELSRSAVVHNVSGAATQSKKWLRIGETHEEIHTTSYSYDAYGRVSIITDAEGTQTLFGSASTEGYDVLDRVIALGTGVSGSETITTEYFYDGDSAATPSQGVGNGNLTAVKLDDGEGTSRTTRLYYDVRDRVIARVSPDAPMNLVRYDNLNRPIEEAVYPEPTTPPSLDDIQDLAGSSLPITHTDLNHPAGGKRSWYSLTSYSQRGIAWRSQSAIDPGNALSFNLISQYWYDDEGNVLSSWEPSEPMTIRSYDEHDRVSTIYTSDRLDDQANGLDFTSATSVTGDNIQEQTEYQYDYANGGVLEQVTTRLRTHDTSSTGALTDSSSITSYLGLVYDNALRHIGTVGFGTNKDEFSNGTSTAPILADFNTLSELRNASDTVFFWQNYNSRGLAEDVITLQSGASSADEIVTRNLYDDLNRTIATVENLDDASLSWDNTKGRYVASGLDHTDLSEDRVTSFVHNQANQVTKRVSHLPAYPSGETVQVTEYVYGTTAGSSSNVMDSLIASNNLLKEVRYPLEDTGEAAGASDARFIVKYAFNALGELRGVTDQNQTVRSFERDLQGRVKADIVETPGTYQINSVTRNIDTTIRRIGYGYDELGRMVGTTSHTTTADSGNIRDEVEISYTPMWQVETIAQQHDGVVTTSSPTVEYEYDDKSILGASDNYSRLQQLNYPTDVANGRKTVKFAYNNRLSRLSKIRVLGLNGTNSGGTPSNADLVNYDYIGMSQAVKTSLNVGSAAGWDAVLDRTVNHDGTSTAGAYPAFDRFGRVVSHMWVRDDFGPQSPLQTYANQPAFMEIGHTYDRSSNRTSYDDNREGAMLPDRDRAFSYDRLNRLTEELRTPIPSGSVYTSQHASQQWNLDTLGNWDDKTTDSDHDGSFSDLQGVNHFDDREHNQANEIESGLQYDQRLYTSGLPDFSDHHYDDNGNMTDERKGPALPLPGSLMAGQVHTYDAWNRLVKSEYLTSTGVPTTISENTYNGLGWRTSKSFDTSEGAYDGLDQKRLYYYDASWRLLEERIDLDVTTNSDSVGGTDDDSDWISQQFWGARYIDDAIAKRVDRDSGGADGDWIDADCSYWYQLSDTQFSVGVVLDQDGHVFERVEYDAYGVARHRDSGDANGDGGFDFFDFSLFGGYSIGNASYHVDYDVNADGVMDATDITILTAQDVGRSTLPGGWLSDPDLATGPDNNIGYAGYVFNHEREDYLVRMRVYDPGLGRWIQRDPIGYDGGYTLTEFNLSSPLNWTDFSGMEPTNREWPNDFPRDISDSDLDDIIKEGKNGTSEQKAKAAKAKKAKKLRADAKRLKGKSGSRRGRRGFVDSKFLRRFAIGTCLAASAALHKACLDDAYDRFNRAAGSPCSTPEIIDAAKSVYNIEAAECTVKALARKLACILPW